MCCAAVVCNHTRRALHGADGQETFEFCGLRLVRIRLSDAVAWITAAAQANDPAVVVTPNINHLHLVQTSPEARHAVERADLQLADGWPIVAASRMLGDPLPERVAGIDLVDRLVRSDTGFSVAILGGSSDAATKLADVASARNQVALVDELAPGWDRPERRNQLAARLEAAQPNLTILGIGAPRQELLAHELKGVVAGPIICCGAAVEVLAGVRPRAPRILQRVGLEWAFRLAIEPRRLVRRYLLAGFTFARLLGATWARRNSLTIR
jgi:N-acetylglucosaminyldiphosphoundecaprenol N-acetyl-beta-D-mannosaminyltransferase